MTAEVFFDFRLNQMRPQEVREITDRDHLSMAETFATGSPGSSTNRDGIRAALYLCVRW